MGKGKIICEKTYIFTLVVETVIIIHVIEVEELTDAQAMKSKLVELGSQLTKEDLKQELDWVCEKLLRNLNSYGSQFPSAEAENGKYRREENTDWTNGFWTGMLWIAYEHTSDTRFKEAADRHVQSFKERLEKHIVLDHHDLGFLYSLSTGAAYKICQDETIVHMLIEAADKLISRFQEKGGFIQAWGQLDNEEEHRLIIDSLMNLPLLYTVTQLTGDQTYSDRATTHYYSVVNNIFRDDYSTHHTFYFDPKTGNPLKGVTHQGFKDDSCWARGQAWAVSGLPFNSKHQSTLRDEKLYKEAVDYFIGQLPEDIVPYWDFAFIREDKQSRDSSSLSIAACGLLEAGKQNLYPNAHSLAAGMVKYMMDHYTSKDDPENEGLLLHGVYAYAHGKGIDEPNIWGDYFYVEALYRLLNPTWETYW